MAARGRRSGRTDLILSPAMKRRSRRTSLRRGASRSVPGTLALLVAVAFATSGCGQILGVSEYSVANGCPDGHYADATTGQCKVVGTCAPDELPPACTKIGAATDGCASGLFTPDTAHLGGCAAIFGCADAGSLAGLGTNTCSGGFSCQPEDFPAGYPPEGQTAIFVSASASPNGTGTEQAPYQKIQDALRAAAALPSSSARPTIILGQVDGVTGELLDAHRPSRDLAQGVRVGDRVLQRRRDRHRQISPCQA